MEFETTDFYNLIYDTHGCETLHTKKPTQDEHFGLNKFFVNATNFA